MPAAKSPAKTKKPTPPVKLRCLSDVLKEIKDTLNRPGCLGIKGFSITAKTEKSTVNLKWGDLKVPRRGT